MLCYLHTAICATRQSGGRRELRGEAPDRARTAPPAQAEEWGSTSGLVFAVPRRWRKKFPHIWAWCAKLCTAPLMAFP